MGDVLILTGPPGSGKTTVARLLTVAHERAVHLESDVFFHFITSGFIAPWTDESNSQNTVVMDAVAAAGATYARAGYFTVIDGIFGPRWFFPPSATLSLVGDAESHTRSSAHNSTSHSLEPRPARPDRSPTRP
jgi:energy-coupling factor transporter ATP-binding protein EcfA2